MYLPYAQEVAAAVLVEEHLAVLPCRPDPADDSTPPTAHSHQPPVHLLLVVQLMADLQGQLLQT